MRDYRDAKQMASTLRAALAARNVEMSHSAALEIVAAQFGLPDWNVLAAKIAADPTAPADPAAPVAIAAPVPILRIFDVTTALAFYRDWLGFTLDWEHRFGPDFPLYAQVSRDDCVLHLSQHHGDASPGGAVFIPLRNVAAFHQELHTRPYPFLRPGLETVDWGVELTLTDPFSNRLRFCERMEPR